MRRVLAVAGLLVAGCPSTEGVPCGDAGACASGDYCLFQQCEASSAVLQNLSAVVYPNDSRLAPQQFLPSDLTAAVSNNVYILDVDPPQQLTGHVGLPPACQDGGGYPVLLHFEAPSLIPSVSMSFDFIDDGLPGNEIIAALPTQTNFEQRISADSACAPPLLGEHDTEPGSYAFSTLNITLPAATAIVSGPVIPVPGDVLPAGIAVRVRDPSTSSAGQSLSVDTTLQSAAVTDGGYRTDAGVFNDGGYVAYWFEVPVASLPQTGVGPGCEATPKSPMPTCYAFVVELGPSPQVPDFPTVDIPLEAPAPLDAGPVQAITFQAAILPISVVPQIPVSISVADADGGLTNAVVLISTADGGDLLGCDGGCDFELALEPSPSATTQLLPGDYTLTLEPLPPDGLAVSSLTVFTDGGLLLNGVLLPLDGGIQLIATPPQHVTGTVLRSNGRGTISGGQAEVLTLPDLAPVAIQGLDAGSFDLLVPPGPSYLLLIEPLDGTEFAAIPTPISVTAGTDVTVRFEVAAAGVLNGVVRLLPIAAGQSPTPLANALIDFYFTQSDPATGAPVAIPITSAITDSQGNWSALGPSSPSSE